MSTRRTMLVVAGLLLALAMAAMIVSALVALGLL
jgi:hypothetical protein